VQEYTCNVKQQQALLPQIGEKIRNIMQDKHIERKINENGARRSSETSTGLRDDSNIQNQSVKT
jgi:hypothetical protein